MREITPQPRDWRKLARLARHPDPLPSVPAVRRGTEAVRRDRARAVAPPDPPPSMPAVRRGTEAARGDRAIGAPAGEPHDQRAPPTETARGPLRPLTRLPRCP